VRTVAAGEPLEQARQIAAELDGDLAENAEAARAGVTARLEAARRLAADRANPGGVDPATIGRLRVLGAALERAERIRSQTEVSVSDSLAKRLSIGTGLTVHPSSLRTAANAVLVAERGEQAARARLDALGPSPEHNQSIGVEMPMRHDDDSEDRGAASRTRLLAVGLAAVVVGATAIAAGADLVPVWVFAVGSGLALLVALIIVRRGRASRAEKSARRQASESLDLAAATAQRAGGGIEAIDEWTGKQAALTAQVEVAATEHRAAVRAWEALAGPGADAYDLDAVLHARDPQHQIAPSSLTASPAVRTANAFHRRALARWRVAWAALGVDVPPEPDGVDDALARLHLPEAQSRDPDQRFADVALVTRPLVLVDPYMALDEDSAERLRHDVDALPPDATVVVVEPTGLTEFRPRSDEMDDE
jgi:hypothetical protein